MNTEQKAIDLQGQRVTLPAWIMTTHQGRCKNPGGHLLRSCLAQKHLGNLVSAVNFQRGSHGVGAFLSDILPKVSPHENLPGVLILLSGHFRYRF